MYSQPHMHACTPLAPHNPPTGSSHLLPPPPISSHPCVLFRVEFLLQRGNKPRCFTRTYPHLCKSAPRLRRQWHSPTPTLTGIMHAHTGNSTSARLTTHLAWTLALLSPGTSLNNTEQSLSYSFLCNFFLCYKFVYYFVCNVFTNK